MYFFVFYAESIMHHTHTFIIDQVNDRIRTKSTHIHKHIFKNEKQKSTGFRVRVDDGHEHHRKSIKRMCSTVQYRRTIIHVL